MPPLHKAHVFCSGREQSTYCKHSLKATIKLYACHAVKIEKNNPPPPQKKKFKQGGAGSAFDVGYLMGNE